MFIECDIGLTVLLTGDMLELVFVLLECLEIPANNEPLKRI